MKIAIIGAGFTGLSAAWRLQQKGHEVTIFEKETRPGGLAIGYQENNWEWPLEKHYHHWFTNDSHILNLAKEFDFPVLTKRITTSVYINNNFYQLDSPRAVLLFAKLPLIDRVRMGATLGFLKINPFWRPLEKIKATAVLPKLMGKKAWEMLWLPQLTNKMGKYANDISLVWFWTRITKRTPSVAYPSGGFLRFAEHIVKAIQKKGGNVNFATQIISLNDNKNVTITYKEASGTTKQSEFDRAIVTLPSSLFLKIAPQLPQNYTDKLVHLKGLSATNLLIRMTKPFFPNHTYWLSICEKNSPVMAIIEHTNFMNPEHYHNEHLIYVGNYATTDDKLDWTKEKLLALYDPILKKIHPNYEKNIIDYQVFTAPFAQPIVPINYSRLIPPMHTPLPHVYLANIEQVYPWDRGTNYAVELGEKVARELLKNT